VLQQGSKVQGGPARVLRLSTMQPRPQRRPSDAPHDPPTWPTPPAKAAPKPRPPLSIEALAAQVMNRYSESRRVAA
jgi:hypothetical protein